MYRTANDCNESTKSMKKDVPIHVHIHVIVKDIATVIFCCIYSGDYAKCLSSSLDSFILYLAYIRV